MRQEEKQLRQIDHDYYLLLQINESGQYSGEVIRRKGPNEETATHLFDIPPQADVQATEQWAIQALQAYREG